MEKCSNNNCLFHDMTRQEAEVEIEKIAVRGAKAALKELGLSDEQAATDMRSLREMLKDWRLLKKSVVRTLAKWLGIIALGYLTIRFDLLQYVKAGR